MRYIIAALLCLFASPSFSQGLEPGGGIQTFPYDFRFGWYDDSDHQRGVWSALENIRTEPYVTHQYFRGRVEKKTWHLRERAGIDQMLQDRATRVQGNVMAPTTRIVKQWRAWYETVGMNYTWQDADGRPWHIHKFLLDEFILTGHAVSNFTRCQPRNKIILELKFGPIEDVGRFCDTANNESRQLLGLFIERSLKP